MVFYLQTTFSCTLTPTCVLNPLSHFLCLFCELIKICFVFHFWRIWNSFCAFLYDRYNRFNHISRTLEWWRRASWEEIAFETDRSIDWSIESREENIWILIKILSEISTSPFRALWAAIIYWSLLDPIRAAELLEKSLFLKWSIVHGSMRRGPILKRHRLIK